MNADVLCSILAQRIPPEQYRLDGLDIKWSAPDYDTPENRAIVADVVENYDSLAKEYLAGEEKAARERAVLESLKDIDIKSIRSIREWIAAQPGAPEFVKDYEAQAKVERGRLR